MPPAQAKPEEALARAVEDGVRRGPVPLASLGHDVHAARASGASSNPIRKAVEEFKPDIAFNLLEAFDDVATWDQNVVAYLELLKMTYTGCNARGLLLSRDKALAKKLLSYHRIRGRRLRGRPPAAASSGAPSGSAFPLFVKSLTLDASIGISQASVVESEEKLQERVRFIHESIGTDALVERYIEGRELYVGILGNQRLQGAADLGAELRQDARGRRARSPPSGSSGA